MILLSTAHMLVVVQQTSFQTTASSSSTQIDQLRTRCWKAAATNTGLHHLRLDSSYTPTLTNDSSHRFEIAN
jgi:hypothetical protein